MSGSCLESKSAGVRRVKIQRILNMRDNLRISRRDWNGGDRGMSCSCCRRAMSEVRVGQDTVEMERRRNDGLAEAVSERH